MVPSRIGGCGQSTSRSSPLLKSIILGVVVLLSRAAAASTPPPRAEQTPHTSPLPPAASRPDDEEGARPLSKSAPDAGEIAAGGLRRYEVGLAAGEFLRLRVEKGDVSLRLTVFEPGGRPFAEFVSRRYGPLHASVLAKAGGAYRIELHSLETGGENGGYELRVEEARAATGRDGREVAAAGDASEAERLRAEWSGRSLGAAEGKYLSAAAAWRAGNRREEAVGALIEAGDIRLDLSDYRGALRHYVRALGWSREAGDVRGELTALNGIGYAHAYLGENRKALGYFEEVERRCDRELRPGTAEGLRVRAQALNHSGEVYYSLSRYDKALGLFGRAGELWEAARDRRGRALALLNLGYTYNDTGELQRAAESYGQALALWRAVGYLRGEALCRTALGGIHALHGENQTALDQHNEAARLFRALGDLRGEAASYNGLGYVYDELNERRLALDCFGRALELYRAIGHRDFEALTLNCIGRLYHALGDAARAFEHFERSIRLSRAVGDRQAEAAALRDSGAAYAFDDDGPRALARLGESLRLFREVGNRRGRAVVLNLVGQVRYRAGERQEASAHFRSALEMFRAVGDPKGQTSALYNLARAARDGGALEEARSLVEESIDIIEALRINITNQDLRTSYFASVHQHHELYIDVLMRLHARHPAGGFDALALQASEGARARSLLEMLTQARIAPRRAGDPALLARESSLRQALADKSEYQARLLNGSHTEEQAAKAAEDLRRLMADYREVQSRLAAGGPAYAGFASPRPLGVGEIQKGLLDEDTLLLEYALGDERSYLWLVTPAAISSYELPGRRVLEDAARGVYELLAARQPAEGETAQQHQARVADADARYWPLASALSRMLLGPVSGQLGTKRLLIVGDGALRRIPFEALPVASAEPPAHGGAAPPLLLGNEVITLPSVSTLAALRGRAAPPAGASEAVVVFADPVFESDDPRVQGTAVRQVEGGQGAGTALASLRGFEEVGGRGHIPRLASTLREARAIMAVVPPGRGVLAAGLDADRETAAGGLVGGASVVHFATHGYFDGEHPALSGVLLSLVDERGGRREGVLRLQDIYNLDLSADLVVLSACQTALGKDVSGEGIIGLARGFMYAGADGVVASLWKVDDEATAELMKRFYDGLLREGLPPAAALRAAKVAMWEQERWRAPYYWAAFVLQGEYDAPVRAARRGPGTGGLVAAAALLAVLSLGAGLALRRARGR